MDPSAAASSSTSGASKANYDLHGGGTGGSSNSASSSWKNSNAGAAHFPLPLHSKGKLGNVHFFYVWDMHLVLVAHVHARTLEYLCLKIFSTSFLAF